jgi:hypothetical protein
VTRRLAWIIIGVLVLVGAGAVWAILYARSLEVSSVTGVVLRDDSDVQRQLSLHDVTVSTDDITTKTDASGVFRLNLKNPLYRGQLVALKFEHPKYRRLDLLEPADNRLYVARMKPRPPEVPEDPDKPPVVLSNVKIRYAVNNLVTQNVGSTSKILTVANKANVPCDGKSPCSPDGKWTATMGWASLDAGDGNELWNPRASCVAGPCAFARIEYENSSKGGRMFDVSVRNWSDAVTYVLEAEVAHTSSAETVRRSYPVTLGPAMSFTMPLEAQGLSIEAEVDGAFTVFPLGPSLRLSWADCSSKSGINQTRLYRCQLKSGYLFRN